MDAPLQDCSIEEQRGVVRFLWAEGVKPVEIHRRMLAQYGQSDYYKFGPLKEALRGRRFDSDEEVKEAVHSWPREQTKSFFSAGIQKLVQ